MLLYLSNAPLGAREWVNFVPSFGKKNMLVCNHYYVRIMRVFLLLLLFLPRNAILVLNATHFRHQKVKKEEQSSLKIDSRNRFSLLSLTDSC